MNTPHLLNTHLELRYTYKVNFMKNYRNGNGFLKQYYLLQMRFGIIYNFLSEGFSVFTIFVPFNKIS